MESVENISKGDDETEALQASSKALYKVLNPAEKTELDIKEVLGNISRAQGKSHF